MPIITAKNLRFALGAKPLLDGVDFSLEEKEKAGLIGRNGAGKSSLLKILAGLSDPDDGSVDPSRSAVIAYLPQESAFEPNLSAAQAALAGPLGAPKTKSGAAAQAASWATGAVERQLREAGIDPSASVGGMSGGQLKKVALAWAFAQEPNLLMLDEPTNHLDLGAIEWLEAKLKQYPGAVIVISHDRRFLNEVCDRIDELDRGRLFSYPGNFERYKALKAQRDNAEDLANRRFDKLHAQEEAWIRKGVEARRTRDEGRVKRLEAMREEAQARRERVGSVEMSAREAGKSSREVAKLKGASLTLGGKTICRDFDFTVLRGSKIALIGPNGAGKTSLIKLILGLIEPDSGTAERAENIQAAYFDQMREQLNENATVFDSIADGNNYIEIDGKRRHVAGYLSGFLFEPNRLNSPVSSLSGGERNRLLLARLFCRESNVLALDEPTNDLDIDTQEVLERMLLDYGGTILLVSHDRYFLDAVATDSLLFEGDGRIRHYPGGYSDVAAARKREAELAASRPGQTQAKAAGGKTGAKTDGKAGNKTRTSPDKGKAERPSRANRPKRLSRRDEELLESLPSDIEKLEAEIADITLKLSNGEIPAGVNEQSQAAYERIERAHAQIDEKMRQWEELEEKKSLIEEQNKAG